jgi:hypothetical protein
MPKVNIDFNSPLKAEETFKKVKNLLATDEGIRKIDSSIQCQFDDSKMCGDVKGSKFKAEMNVKANGDKSQVSIIVDLPMLLGAFKGQVKSTIEKKLGQILS